MTYKHCLLFTGINLRWFSLEKLSCTITACREISSGGVGETQQEVLGGACTRSFCLSFLRDSRGVSNMYLKQLCLLEPPKTVPEDEEHRFPSLHKTVLPLWGLHLNPHPGCEGGLSSLRRTATRLLIWDCHCQMAFVSHCSVFVVQACNKYRALYFW